MKKILLPVVILFSLVGYAQITIDETLTTQELVEDVLFNDTCATLSNFMSSTGTNFGDDNGIGAFDQNGSDFPFANGVVLTSGNVANAAGPNLITHSDGGGAWPGDADLEANTTATNTNNASWIQFDFVPLTDMISFDFIMASEEYNQNFECTFSDAFAFILTDQNTGVVQNLAVLPGTTIPIEVTNIREEVPGQCAAVNPEFFDKYNFLPFNDENLAAIDFNGQTVELTAMGPVTVGNPYTIKLVVADETDTALDIGVFLEGGSFNIGSVDLGVDLTIDDGNARCEGEEYTIVPIIDAPSGTTFEWQFENPFGSGIFVPFTPPETNATLDVTVTGNYKLIVDFNGACTAEGEVFVEFDVPPVVNSNPDALVVCDPDNDGIGSFVLSVADDDITIMNPDLSVTYHPTFSDAENDLNELPIAYQNDDPFNDVVFARVEDINSSCVEVVILNLIVRNTPDIVAPAEPLRLCDENNPGDGFEVFDLTLVEPEVLNGLSDTEYDFHYFEDLGDAVAAGDSALTAPPGDFTAEIANPTAYQNIITFAQTVYILVVGNNTNTGPNNGGEGCYRIVELMLIVDPLPEAVQLDPYSLCDDEIDGSTPIDQLSTFDLTTQEDAITGGNINVTVTWYETLSDEAADVPIMDASAYQNRTIAPATQPTPQTIYARLTNEFGCKVVSTLTLVVLPNPTPAMPTALEVCDEDNDGFSMFDLTLKDTEIANGEPDVTVAYFETFALAELGALGDAIVGLYPNDTPFTDMVWARVTRVVAPGSDDPACFTIVALELIVNPIPDSPTSEFGDLTFCDENGDGSAEFDLTDNESFVLGMQDPMEFTVSYHTSEADANTPANAIVTPGAYTSSGETIWVRVENNTTGCFRVVSFALIVGEFPSIVAPSDKEVCDDLASGSNTDGFTIFDLTQYDLEITGGDTDLTVFYYETAADQAANMPIADPTMYQNPADVGGVAISPVTLFVSVFNDTGCEATTTITLTVLPVPTPQVPTPLEVCDEDNDGFAMFTLTSKDVEIIGGEAGVTLSYHRTLADAQDNVDAIVGDYQNVLTPIDVVYARATFTDPPNTSGCWQVVELQLIVLPTPEVPVELAPLTACDEDADGFFEFDLTERADDIYGTQATTDYTLSYYTSEADAIAMSNAIADPTMFTNTINPQTIWVRLQDNATGCFSIGSFELQVTLSPVAVDPTPFEKCDDLGAPNDGFTSFNLTLKNDEITGGVAGVEVRYYVTAQDAQDDTNRIDPETDYTNVTNTQEVYVRAIDGNTGCVAFTTLTLEVFPNPVANAADAIELCDDNDPGDMEEVFDLTQRAPQILGGATWDLAYFETEQDAIDNTNAIVDATMYTNTSNPQLVYVRVDIDLLDPETCFEYTTIELIVNPLPDDTAVVEDMIVCEENTDGIDSFDLESKVLEILNGQDPAIHMVTFYRTDAEAASMSNPIVNTTNFLNQDIGGAPINPFTIWVGIENTDTGCYIGGAQSFNLEVQETATATEPAAPYTICDNLDANDGIATFALDGSTQESADINAEILNGQPYTLEFFETFENADARINPLGNSYVNIINPQTIYARVTNNLDPTDADACYAVVEVILKVEQLPLVTLEESYRLCVDINGNPIAEVEGETSPPVIDTGIDPSLFTFVWELNGAVIPGEIGPSIVALAGGTYVVTIIENATGCSTTATTTVTVSAPPDEFSAEVINGAFAASHDIQATASGLGDYIFQLDDGAFQDDGLFTNVSPGDHLITIKDANGCGSVTLDVGVIDYPRFMTPNEDGVHDTWNIIGIAAGDPTAKIYIFDRAGKLLKQISPLDNQGWDGTYQGNPLPSSDYWFRVEYKEQEVLKTFTGHFTLKR